jgi:hypothetical protein
MFLNFLPSQCSWQYNWKKKQYQLTFIINLHITCIMVPFITYLRLSALLNMLYFGV